MLHAVDSVHVLSIDAGLAHAKRGFVSKPRGIKAIGSLDKTLKRLRSTWMKTAQLRYSPAGSWSGELPSAMDSERTLVLVFGSRSLLDEGAALADLREAFPKSHRIGCSSAGQIAARRVEDDGLDIVVTQWQDTQILAASAPIRDACDSEDAGRRLATQFPRDELRAVLVLSTATNVNAAALVRGITESMPAGVIVSGGVAADGSFIERDWVLDNTGLREHAVTAVGFYGRALRISHGCVGGWTEFGPCRTVTHSEGNVLHELDGQPALALYKHYLGDLAAGLPASALLFPLALRLEGSSDEPVVRAILDVDPVAESMTFGGDIPRGATVRLMRATVDRLVTAAEYAVRHALDTHLPKADAPWGPMLALSVSCVGRRMVMGERTEEEVEALVDYLPSAAVHAGFYSFGEIAPAHGQTAAQLHNQTITLTVLSEA